MGVDHIKLLENSDIETVFKVEPPIKELQNGHGFMGVVLRDKKLDKIQCHVCGGWYGALGAHLKHAHKTNSKEYKKTFGLPLGFPLCSRKKSASTSARARRPENLKFLAGVRRPDKATRKTGRIINTHYGKNCAAFKNKKGICEEQLLKRYLIVCDIVEKEACMNEMRLYDEAALQAIIRKYGRWNTFKKRHSFDYIVKPEKVTESKVIAALRSFYQKYKRVPRASDFRRGSPCAPTIRKIFGSWHRALECAGFDVIN